MDYRRIIMSYVDPNYPTKKAFKQAVKDGVHLRTYNPGGMFEAIQNGTDTIEGPHYPAPHKWYARVSVVDGLVTKVIS
jgi:hypothetical protein